MASMHVCCLVDGTAAAVAGPSDHGTAAQNGLVEELVGTPRRSDAAADQSQVVRVILEHVRNKRVVTGL